MKLRDNPEHHLHVALIVLSYVLASQLVFGPESVAGQEVDKPNVIIIYADDLGSIDAHCYGSQDLETPHIDRLAGSGVRFTQMYAPSAICSSSRAGLMTGRIPARAGVPGNVSSQKGEAGMPTEEVTIAETRQQMVVGMDWLPTIAELTGAQLPPSPLDGESIVSVIRSQDQPSPHESMYWQLGSGANAQWVVRAGDWKLLGNPRDIREPKSLGTEDKLFLANIRTNPDEKENFASQHPDVVKQFVEIKERYWQEINGSK